LLSLISINIFGSPLGTKESVRDMDSNSALPQTPFPAIPNDVEEEQAPETKKSMQWELRSKVVGYLENARIINTYPGMHDVDVNKNVELHFLHNGTKDFLRDDAFHCCPVENIREALGYKGPFWNEWRRRISAMREKIPLMLFNRGLPDVR